jgi:hypothetical protein
MDRKMLIRNVAGIILHNRLYTQLNTKNITIKSFLEPDHNFIL